MGPSQIRDQTPLSCIGKQILDHWATREALILYLLARLILPSLSHQWPPHANMLFHPCMSTHHSSFHLCAYGETLLSLHSNLWPFPWSRGIKRQRRWNCSGGSKPLERKSSSCFHLGTWVNEGIREHALLAVPLHSRAGLHRQSSSQSSKYIFLFMLVQLLCLHCQKQNKSCLSCPSRCSCPPTNLSHP